MVATRALGVSGVRLTGTAVASAPCGTRTVMTAGGVVTVLGWGTGAVISPPEWPMTDVLPTRCRTAITSEVSTACTRMSRERSPAMRMPSPI